MCENFFGWSLIKFAALIALSSLVVCLVQVAEGTGGEYVETEFTFRAGLPGLTSDTPIWSGLTLPSLISQRDELHPVAQRMLSNAEKESTAGHWLKAFGHIEVALKWNPDHPLLLSRAAALLSLLQRYQEAYPYFKRSLELNPENNSVRFAFVALLQHMEQWQEMLNHLEHVYCKNDREELNKLYLECWAKQFIDQATCSVEQWKELDFNALFQLTLVLKGDLKLHSHKALGEVANQLIELYLGLPNRTTFVEYLDVLEEVHTAKKHKRFDHARGLLDQLKAWTARPYAYDMEIQYCRFQQGSLDEAEEGLRSMSRTYPHQKLVWYNYGLVLLQRAKYGKAVEAFEMAERLHEQTGQHTFALACAYIMTGQEAEAWPRIFSLATDHPVELKRWLDGEAPYLLRLKSERPYLKLSEMLDLNY